MYNLTKFARVYGAQSGNMCKFDHQALSYSKVLSETHLFGKTSFKNPLVLAIPNFTGNHAYCYFLEESYYYTIDHTGYTTHYLLDRQPVAKRSSFRDFFSKICLKINFFVEYFTFDL